MNTPEPNGYVTSQKIMEEIEYAASLFNSPAWNIIREAIHAEEEGGKVSVQRYTDLKCVEVATFSDRYCVRATVRADRQAPVRFYFWRDGLPEVEVKAAAIVALGVSEITNQLDAVYQLQAEVGLLYGI
jgi:hypothetical protein